MNTQNSFSPLFEGSGRLMFITHPTARYSEIEELQQVLDGGCTWVQLRMKGTLNLAAARKAAALLARYDSRPRLCIDDDVSIALESGADAVHLGKNDLPVAEAWRRIGPKRKEAGFRVGATANTLEDIRRAATAGASYIGLGPYRYTETKKNLSPVLGAEGYRRLIGAAREAGIDLPILAIGGILLEDVPVLMATGVSGLAVSGAIAGAPDPTEATRRFLDEINNY